MKLKENLMRSNAMKCDNNKNQDFHHLPLVRFVQNNKDLQSKKRNAQEQYAESYHDCD